MYILKLKKRNHNLHTFGHWTTAVWRKLYAKHGRVEWRATALEFRRLFPFVSDCVSRVVR